MNRFGKIKKKNLSIDYDDVDQYGQTDNEIDWASRIFLYVVELYGKIIIKKTKFFLHTKMKIEQLKMVFQAKKNPKQQQLVDKCLRSFFS